MKYLYAILASAAASTSPVVGHAATFGFSSVVAGTSSFTDTVDGLTLTLTALSDIVPNPIIGELSKSGNGNFVGVESPPNGINVDATNNGNVVEALLITFSEAVTLDRLDLDERGSNDSAAALLDDSFSLIQVLDMPAGGNDNFNFTGLIGTSFAIAGVPNEGGFMLRQVRATALPAPVPLPAGLPLLAVGLGGFILLKPRFT
ncbi:MAG: hypothetical protein AAGF71_14900 [Pseudomonadota bacterium]